MFLSVRKGHEPELNGGTLLLPSKNNAQLVAVGLGECLRFFSLNIQRDQPIIWLDLHSSTNPSPEIIATKNGLAISRDLQSVNISFIAFGKLLIEGMDKRKLISPASEVVRDQLPVPKKGLLWRQMHAAFELSDHIHSEQGFAGVSRSTSLVPEFPCFTHTRRSHFPTKPQARQSSGPLCCLDVLLLVPDVNFIITDLDRRTN
jgi:hypothetical protein